MNIAHRGAIVLDLERVDEGRNVLDFAVTAEGIELADPYFQFPSPIEVGLVVNRSLHALSVGRQRPPSKQEPSQNNSTKSTQPNTASHPKPSVPARTKEPGHTP